jgi:hypothetical protein
MKDGADRILNTPGVDTGRGEQWFRYTPPLAVRSNKLVDKGAATTRTIPRRSFVRRTPLGGILGTRRSIILCLFVFRSLHGVQSTENRAEGIFDAATNYNSAGG